MFREKLYGKTLNELIAVTRDAGMPGYAARQLADWLYKKKISSIGDMTNLQKKSREQLNEKYEFGLSGPVNESESADGTKKYLFRIGENRYIETAFIPEKERATICISSQAGCKMGCLFCMTGRQGFQAHLSSNEILNQFRSIPEFNSLTNIVYMGMGEPMDNIDEVLKSLEILTGEWGYAWSPGRITVSTIGLVSAVKKFLDLSRCNLAISLHSPFDEEREYLIPVQKKHPLKELLDVIRSFDFSHQRRISFEYILFRGLNDSPGHVKELARILNGIKCRINLIRFHPIPDSPLQSPDNEHIVQFKELLNAKDILTTIRISRGEDIMAACGLLSTLNQNKQG